MLYDLASDLDRQRATKRWEYLLQRNAVVDLTEHVQRTNSQNAYLHVLLGLLAMEFGERIEYVKQNYYKELVNPALFVMRKDDRFLGERVELRSSRDLTKEEMAESIDRLKVWAAEQGIFLPSADEKEFLARIEAEMRRNAKYL